VTPTDTCAICRKPITWGEWFIDEPDQVNGPLFWVRRHMDCQLKGETNGN
jgi:hypothetical protein